ncbi:hypothetical protein J4N02_01830 [Propioniciclava sp. MC1595]|uniref:hypothetical protein n=1 Tax=Propioniciclava sp. MC1595 TaxID=2760308 RepID=UPI0016624D2D|nr:hypothetical protein [Propioniciclava sp. MC1595]MBB1495269.1 hypothetical protein [Propioniciclava sp. MC1595]QTE26393.1 hypothetical protein J4N02_01830 [Propioniciclava sp. MC1595]
MTIAKLFWEVENSPKWQVVHRASDLLVVEVAEGLAGRSQFVELRHIVRPTLERFGAPSISFPEVLQVMSRMSRHSGGYYDADDDEFSRIMDIVLNDFQLFGRTRLFPFQYLSMALPIEGLSTRTLETAILAVGFVADRVEHTLSSGRLDQF